MTKIRATMSVRTIEYNKEYITRSLDKKRVVTCNNENVVYCNLTVNNDVFIVSQ